MLVKLMLNTGIEIWVNPQAVNCVYAGPDNKTTRIELSLDAEHPAIVLGTPAEVAAKLNGAEGRNA